ncbi:MAG: hypothetical protein ACI854_002950, partial [Arenicella sp.]
NNYDVVILGHHKKLGRPLKRPRLMGGGELGGLFIYSDSVSGGRRPSRRNQSTNGQRQYFNLGHQWPDA